MISSNHTSTKKTKYVIVMRHGERIDKVPDLKDNQLLPRFDPELTSYGKSQATSNGQFLSQTLTNTLSLPITPSSLKCISSPYTRTLQTSKAVLSALSFPLPLTIHVDNLICEFLDDAFEGNNPIDFLSIIQGNKSKSYDYYKEELKEVNLIVRNDYGLLPKVLEKRSELVSRVEEFSERLKKEMFDDGNEEEAVLLVSHGATVTHLCDCFGYEKHLDDDDVRLCDYFIFEVGKDEETKEISSKFIIRKI